MSDAVHKCEKIVRNRASFLGRGSACGNTAKQQAGDVWLCGIHLPRSMKPETAVQRRQREAQETDKANKREAKELSSTLGVNGSAAFRWINSQSPRYRRELVIPFDEVKKLIARLEQR